MASFHMNTVKFNDRDVQNLNQRDLYVSVPLMNADTTTTVGTPTTTTKNSAIRPNDQDQAFYMLAVTLVLGFYFSI